MMETPPLPKHYFQDPRYGMSQEPAFNADQMREYGESCARMAREEERARCIQACEDERPNPPGPYCPWSDEEEGRYDALTEVIAAIRKGSE